MLVAFSVAPSGSHDDEGSVHDAVAAAVRIVRASGLPNHTDSMFTTIEGDWDEVFAVVKAATEAVGAWGPRVSLVLKADIRGRRTGELTGKVERLEAALAEAAASTAATPAA
ncbi:thiamine-binding protein [Cryobacterium sp. TMT1-62]|uniref:Thiamine-binding protein n=1 Tax=Cryobacterium sandaracinum TaxID=1259247 RepID=A0ABY2JCI0_9MICO|nr:MULTISPECIES: thiamine-binding protein [Cryobacterium]TFB61276.1 thiamine-binding protein [Cryobacterium sp. Sr3]TFB62967.1 thiamine-binding protein [Cryobacterium sp. Hz7]TFC38035.1 thiamine-binding protein [Cryobacterium sp. TMT2-14]TFC52000.1 thiamine-binding protein [Cryobacterium sp. TMT2-17-1]TFC65491.1 thiamine-binding protein [Cryobacterium sp. TMT2-4]